jgi:protein subunit release factor A
MKKQTVIEIRSAEGGQDSKLLVGEMAAIYEKAARVNSFTIDKKETKEGQTSI